MKVRKAFESHQKSTQKNAEIINQKYNHQKNGDTYKQKTKFDKQTSANTINQA